jgi:hypothetical protein
MRILCWQKLTEQEQAEIEVKDPKIDSILYGE